MFVNIARDQFYDFNYVTCIAKGRLSKYPRVRAANDDVNYITLQKKTWLLGFTSNAKAHLDHRLCQQLFFMILQTCLPDH